MPEFSPYNLDELKESITGKTISGVTIDDRASNNRLIFNFSDGSNLMIEYDWIYEWEMTKA